MVSNRYQWIVAVGLSFAATGCVTEGRDFRSDTAWIVNGRTSRDDVRLMLGEPYAVGNSGGRPTWTYGYYRYRIVGKSDQKELKFYWTPQGAVDTFAFTSSFPEDTSAAVTGGHGPKPLP